jgi:hypothetical protein
VLRTHYYFAATRPVENQACGQLRRNPLIYDYGGKPFASSGTRGTLNVFRDAGSGTDALGIDCSGYVFSAMASAGLRVVAGESLKAQNVYGINSARFMRAPDSGLSCFRYASVSATQSLLPGDVVASDGHVFLVDWVGDDPLGIEAIGEIQDCRLGPISAARFDFVLSQSGPIKGGIGINRIHARDYLLSGEMKTGLEQFAVTACRRRFLGGSETVRPGAVGVVRHRRSAECLDREVYLEHQDCLNSCRF